MVILVVGNNISSPGLPIYVYSGEGLVGGRGDVGSHGRDEAYILYTALQCCGNKGNQWTVITNSSRRSRTGSVLRKNKKKK